MNGCHQRGRIGQARAACLLAWPVFAVCAIAAGAEPGGARLKLWEVPKGATADGRAAWKTADGGALAGGAAVENGRILVLAAAGSPGLVLAAANDGATSVQVRLVPAAGPAGNLDRIEISGKDAGEALLRVGAGAAQASVRIAAGGVSVEVAPVAGCAALEIEGRTKYSVLPDFFGHDAVFVPARCKSDRMAVAAENFLLNLLDGGSMSICTWPSPPATAAGGASRETERSPSVELFFAGEGAARVVQKCRIELLPGRPVSVALIAGKGLWAEQDVGTEPAQKPVRLAWKPPFEAKWRVDFVGKDGQTSKDLLTGVYTWDATYRSECPDGGKDGLFTRGGKPLKCIPDMRPEQDGMPMCCMQGLWPYYISPGWIDDCAPADKGGLFVAMYADAAERKALARTNAKRQADAKKEKKEFVPEYPANVFERVLVYPLDRRENTPLTAVTFTDVMRECLGLAPCGYVLDLEGIKIMPSGGSRETLATCGTWNEYINPFVQATKGKAAEIVIDGKARKLAGLKAGERLAPEDEALLVQKLEDLVLFVTAVNARLREYRRFSAELEKYCDEQVRATPQLKGIATRVRGEVAVLDAKLSDRVIDEKNRQRDEWEKTVRGVIAEVRAGSYSNLPGVGRIRDALAEPQDILLSLARRAVKNIRQEAAVMDTASPDEVRFAGHVRDVCHAMSRNRHMFEGQ